MQSEILRRKDNIQLSFNLPHRIYDTCVYPRCSPNGSKVILYAHEKGLRVIWYGGRKFKTNTEPKPINGDSIDLTGTSKNAQEYEEEDDHSDEPATIPDVLTHLDVPLGTACVRLTIPPPTTEHTFEDYPAILNSHIIVMLAGADQSLKLVTIPLEPKGQQNEADIQVINIVGINSHRDLISDVAITWTAELVDAEGNETRTNLRADTRRPDEPQDGSQVARNWFFLLASASPTGHGLLLTHQIPVDASGRISTDIEDHVPIQRYYLRTSTATCRLMFNTSTYPAERHSHLLLSMTDNSSVKVFNLLPQTKHNKVRRGSTATSDSSASAARSVRQSSSISGRPLITLLSPFASCGSHDLSSKRKSVLDASWILYGQAIIILMSDGEWGIWDLEAAGPSPVGTSNNLVKGQGNVSGICGGSLPKFTIKGSVCLGGQTTKSSSSKHLSSTDSTLAPMTPHTRKIRSEGLFRGSDNSGSLTPSTAAVIKGRISVVPQTRIALGTGKVKDETVLFSYGAQNVVIHSIQAYWRSATGSRSASNASNLNRPSTLPLLITAGEESNTAQLLPVERFDNDANSSASMLTPEFVVATQTRLVISIPPLSTNKTRTVVTSSLPMRLNAARSSNTEQTLLESGELDIDGMDRILNSMANSSAELDSIPAALGRKSVNFQLNDDEEDDDISMSTPTVPKTTKSKLVVTKGAGEPRRLFS